MNTLAERIQPCEFECGATPDYRLTFADGVVYACAAHRQMLLLSPPPKVTIKGKEIVHNPDLCADGTCPACAIDTLRAQLRVYREDR